MPCFTWNIVFAAKLQPQEPYCPSSGRPILKTGRVYVQGKAAVAGQHGPAPPQPVPQAVPAAIPVPMSDSEFNIEADLAEKTQQLEQKAGSLDQTYWNLFAQVTRLEGEVLHFLLSSCMLPPISVALLPFMLPFMPPHCIPRQCIPRPPRANSSPKLYAFTWRKYVQCISHRIIQLHKTRSIQWQIQWV